MNTEPVLYAQAQIVATRAFKIAAMYPDSIPKARELMYRFDMAQATAYRYIAALKSARGIA